MSPKTKKGILWCYVVLAIGAPLFTLIFPGQPPLALNKPLLEIKGNRFAAPMPALGEGADVYEFAVLEEMVNRRAGMSADYPDGSSALISRFATPHDARQAMRELLQMIPHQNENKDLWSTHFLSDGGEYVVLAVKEDVLVLVIADREEVARERLASLPALKFNHHPGLGAVLKQQPFWIQLLGLLFYILIQYWLIKRIKHWVDASPAGAA